MQLGFTMFEKMNFDAGQLRNASLADYKIPGFHDLPREMVSEAVDAEQRTGPFGAKGVGESGTFGVSPAIANAIEDAVGVRLTSLPLTAEAVYRALRAARKARRWRTTEMKPTPQAAPSWLRGARGGAAKRLAPSYPDELK